MAYHLYDVQIWAPLLEQLENELLKTDIHHAKEVIMPMPLFEAQNVTIFG